MINSLHLWKNKMTYNFENLSTKVRLLRQYLHSWRRIEWSKLKHDWNIAMDNKCLLSEMTKAKRREWRNLFRIKGLASKSPVLIVCLRQWFWYFRTQKSQFFWVFCGLYYVIYYLYTALLIKVLSLSKFCVHPFRL